MGNIWDSGKIAQVFNAFSLYSWPSKSSPDHPVINENNTDPIESTKKEEDTKPVTEPSEQVIMIFTEKPLRADPVEPRKKNPMSLGLQIDSILGSKTEHLKERYNLGNELGRGHYGKTFLCVDRKTHESYACKSIAKRRLLTEDDVSDVRREIEIMRHLSGAHPNLVSIRGAYEDSVAVHVVMELCKGGELFDRVADGGRYSERKAAGLTRTIVGLVMTCHSLGVMHRDLKPENFLFVGEGEDSELKLIDFGLSVYFKEGEILSDVVGSPYYLAPEVLRGRYGPQADVWSVGVIVYILLCGQLPFWGESDEEVFERVLHGEIDFDSDPWSDISESAKDLVKRMLVRNPARRITANQVLRHPWLQEPPDQSSV